MTKKEFKPRFHLNDKTYAGAGIIIYNDQGFFLGKERQLVDGKLVTKMSDFGGKYDYTDGDIYSTIARELREETYNHIDLRRKDILQLLKCKRTLIKDTHVENIYYRVILVHYNDLKAIDPTFYVPSTEQMVRSRDLFIKMNSGVPKYYYSTVGIIFIKRTKLKAKLKTGFYTRRTERIIETLIM